MTLTYSKVGGTLPPGFQLNHSDGQVSHVFGTATFDESVAPVWVTPSGNLGTFDEKTAVNLSALVVNAANGLDNYSIVGTAKGLYYSLPWGLSIDPHTGVITGTIQQLFDTGTPTANPWSTAERPTWGDNSTLTADFKEGDVVNIQLNASPNLGSSLPVWYVTSGGLPWGLELQTATGKIVGTIAEIQTPEAQVSITPIPTWNTPVGLLGNVNEGQTTTITLSATPNVGTSVIYYVTTGGLPWGLELNTSTGDISGTVGEVQIYEAPFAVGNGPMPVVDAASNLGSFNNGTVVNLDLSFTPIPGRTMVGYWLEQAPDGLPWGLVLNTNTGAVTGTIASGTAKDFTFTIYAMDSARATTKATYTITCTGV